VKKEEECAKCVLSYFGKRAEAFGLQCTLLGAFAEKDYYVDKIKYLIERFDISTLYIGTPKLHITWALNCNIFRINRPCGFIPDRVYLKQAIHKEDISRIREFSDETLPKEFERSWDDKVTTDFIIYKFSESFQLTENERQNISEEVLGTLDSLAHTTKHDRPTQNIGGTNLSGSMGLNAGMSGGIDGNDDSLGRSRELHQGKDERMINAELQQPLQGQNLGV